MKILAIRGENLASLTGPFSIELDQAPLRDAGLFAITGQTGSGKSTLLDAICVALYDATPRLSARGGPAVGRDPTAKNRLKANDVRGLVSRGKVAGFAEVDFIGVDHRRYRVRWEARKGRNKVSGRFQKVERSIRGLDDEIVFAGKKTEVQAAIQERVGLSFEQFRRSALLAQGDFAAFLKAGEDERAELLERMTGTEIYSRVSIAAYERAKLEKRVLDDLAIQVERLGVMSPEKREQTQQHHTESERQKSTADAALEAAKADQQWWTTDRSLAAEVASGTQAVQDAAVAVDRAEPRRQRLARVERAQPLRPTLRAVLEGTTRKESATNAELQLDEQIGLAQAASEAAAREAEHLRLVAAHARATEEQAQEPLRAAEKLDDQIKALSTEIAEASAELLGLSTQVTAAEERLATTQHTIAQHTAAAATAQEWLSAQGSMPRIAANWDRIAADLERLAQLKSQLPLCRTSVEDGASTLAALDAEAQGARATHTEVLSVLKTVEAAYTRLNADIAPMAKTLADARAERHREQAQQSLAALQLAERAQEWAGGVQSATAVLKAATAKSAELSTQEHTLREAAKGTQIRLEEAHAAEVRATSTASLEQHRTQLRPDEPCALCGSTHHPYITGDAVPPGLAEQQARVRELRTQLAEQQSDTVKLAERRSTTVATLEQAQIEAQECRSKLASSESLWAEFRALRPELTESLVDPDCVQTARAWTIEATGQVEKSAAQVKALRAQEQARDTALGQRDAAAATEKQARAALNTLDERQRTLEKQHVEHSQRLSGLRDQQERTLQDLTAALSDRHDWPEPLALDPTQARATLGADVQCHAQHQEALNKANLELRPLELAQVAQREQLTQITATRDVAHTTQEARKTERATRTNKRALLFDGEPINQVRAGLRTAVTVAEAAHKQAQDTERKASDHHSALGGRKVAARQATRRAVDALTLAETLLTTALAESEFDRATLDDLLGHDSTWITQERADLQALTNAVSTAGAVLQERTTKLHTHRESSPPTAEEEAASALEAAEQAHAAATDTLATVAADLRRDDLARTQAQDKQREIDAQNAVYKRWASLSEVIGAASGKKLRNFAQGLTLEVLLTHANHHLMALAPRYRLDRIPDAQLELQMIDTDMGDEVRAVNSLSGGETFLTSLALALGLSSLSANHTPVESLFIDEGFGTLDAETLELAFDALNTLQASGRQVGIISHVEALVDRVAVQVKVERLGAGQSRVVVAATL